MWCFFGRIREKINETKRKRNWPTCIAWNGTARAPHRRVRVLVVAFVLAFTERSPLGVSPCVGWAMRPGSCLTSCRGCGCFSRVYRLHVTPSILCVVCFQCFLSVQKVPFFCFQVPVFGFQVPVFLFTSTRFWFISTCFSGYKYLFSVGFTSTCFWPLPYF